MGRRAKTGTINTDSSIGAWIGSNPTVSTSRPWKGSISDIRVYQIALSGMEIKDVIANEDDITAPKVLNLQRIVTETTATISWSTNESAESKVEYGLDRNYGQTINDKTLKTEHSLTLTDLKPNRRYHFRVISKDSSGNISARIFNRRFTTSKILTISNIQHNFSHSSSNVTITWETDVPGFGGIDFGLTDDYGQSESEFIRGSGFFHLVTITDLEPETLYHYRIRIDSLDSDNTINSSDLTFITLEAEAFIPGPRISIDHPDHISVSATTVTINWTTDVPATSQINFGFDSNYGTTINNDALVTEHQITLTDLDPNTWYRYQISATGALGNTSTRDFLELFESDLRFITSSLNPTETKLACADNDDIRQIKFQDINGDNKTDLLALCNGFILIRVGLGDGRFSVDSQQFNVGNTPSNLQVVDINRDNFADLVMSNSSDVSVLLGLGDGSFETEKRYAAGGVSTHNLALKDINDDDLLDLIITNSTLDDVSILLGKANGTLGTQHRYPIGEGSKRRSLTVITDINEDGHLDLAISFLGEYDTDNRVILLPGNGDGSFNSAEILFSGIDISIDNTIFSDVNGDNHLDLIISSDTLFLVLLGNGDGSFDDPIIHITERGEDSSLFGYRFLEIFDVNEDNFPDIIGGGVIDDANGHFKVWLGKGDGTFTEKSSLTALRDVIASDIIIADLDKDGIQELIINDCCDQDTGLRQDGLLIAKNQGDGVFELMERYDDQGTLFLFGR